MPDPEKIEIEITPAETPPETPPEQPPVVVVAAGGGGGDLPPELLAEIIDRLNECENRISRVSDDIWNTMDNHRQQYHTTPPEELPPVEVIPAEEITEIIPPEETEEPKEDKPKKPGFFASLLFGVGGSD